MKLNPPLVSGTTNGVSSNSVSLLMTLVLIRLESNTSTTDVLKKFHGVQVNMAGDKFAGIDIKWDYANHRCCISMPGYIKKTCSLSFKVSPSNQEAVNLLWCYCPAHPRSRRFRAP